MKLSFTGHRPESLPFGDDESSAASVRMKDMIYNEIKNCAANGYDTFLNGGARGGDIIFAEQVLLVKATEYPNIRLITVVPHEGQANSWSEAWRERYFTDLSPELMEKYRTLLWNPHLFLRSPRGVRVLDMETGGVVVEISR